MNGCFQANILAVSGYEGLGQALVCHTGVQGYDRNALVSDLLRCRNDRFGVNRAQNNQVSAVYDSLFAQLALLLVAGTLSGIDRGLDLNIIAQLFASLRLPATLMKAEQWSSSGLR